MAVNVTATRERWRGALLVRGGAGSGSDRRRESGGGGGPHLLTTCHQPRSECPSELSEVNASTGGQRSQYVTHTAGAFQSPGSIPRVHPSWGGPFGGLARMSPVDVPWPWSMRGCVRLFHSAAAPTRADAETPRHCGRLCLATRDMPFEHASRVRVSASGREDVCHARRTGTRARS